jgi:hypothetical protein
VHVPAGPVVNILNFLYSFMLALTSVCVTRVIIHISKLSKAYVTSPYSKDPVLLLHMAQLHRANWESKMGCLVFIPPMLDDDGSSIMSTSPLL